MQVELSKNELAEFKKNYNEDLLPIEKEKRTWSIFNYFTLWMGSVHNVPNYAAVGSFFLLGLGVKQIIFAIILSAIAVSALMILNGSAGSKYGIPFPILLKDSYGEKGALLPGFLRGCVAAIMWYGIQNYSGSLALYIIIGKLFPSIKALEITSILGLSLPLFICFSLFWLANLGIGLGGGKILNRFTAILNPAIYIVFGGMLIWAIKISGGVTEILNYPVVENPENLTALLACLIIINSALAVWAAPGVSACDFTRNAKDFKTQAIGQGAGLLVAYTLFAFSSVFILIGASKYYNENLWNVLNVIDKWDHKIFAVAASFVLLMTTISTNATGNIIPAAYQLSSIFPKWIDYKKGVILASIISFVIMPWKLMENADSITLFLGMIGSVVGPVSGVMLSHYFIIAKQQIDLRALYDSKRVSYQKGVNLTAFVVTILAVFMPKLLGILGFVAFEKISWLISFFSAFVLYSICMGAFKQIKPKAV